MLHIISSPQLILSRLPHLGPIWDTPYYITVALWCHCSVRSKQVTGGASIGCQVHVLLEDAGKQPYTHLLKILAGHMIQRLNQTDEHGVLMNGRNLNADSAEASCEQMGKISMAQWPTTLMMAGNI